MKDLFRKGYIYLGKNLAEGDEGALHLGPERPCVYSDLSPEDKDRCSWNVQKYKRKKDGGVTSQLYDDFTKHFLSAQGDVFMITMVVVCPDSHSHLFFDCAFSSTVWKEMKSKGRFSFDCHNLQSTVTKLAARKFKSNIWQILNKIILLATVYYIWNERNKRIFTKEIRSADDLIKDIQKCIANVLMSLSLKESGVVAMVAKLWGLYLEKGKLLLII
ncbi:hypothetical protein Tco_0464332 [Tanacetum coccineum]